MVFKITQILYVASGSARPPPSQSNILDAPVKGTNGVRMLSCGNAEITIYI
jgi:hypothetical protein